MSVWKSKRASTGKPRTTLEKSAGGSLPRHKFDNVQTAFRIIGIRLTVLKTLQTYNKVENLANVTIFLNIEITKKNQSIYVSTLKIIKKTIQNDDRMINEILMDFRYRKM